LLCRLLRGGEEGCAGGGLNYGLAVKILSNVPAPSYYLIVKRNIVNNGSWFWWKDMGKRRQ
jgi:hypothetical protein